MKKVFITIIIPVFNDNENLLNCLHAIEKQTVSKEDYEVIVIDNGGAQDPFSVAKKFENVRVVKEIKPGSYAARNRGINEARGEMLAFTDADAIPDVRWIEKGVDIFIGTPNCGFVAGRIDVFAKKLNQPNPVERYEILVSHNQKNYVALQQFGATANLFTSKTIIRKVGNFDGNLKSGGDLEWGQRVASYGFKVVYADDVIVRHPARNTLKALFQRNIRIAGGRIDHRRQYQMPLISTRHLINMILPPFKDIIKNIFMRNSAGRFHQKSALLGVILFVHYVTTFETLRVLLGRKSER